MLRAARNMPASVTIVRASTASLPPPPPHPVTKTLPSEYVAAKFYFSQSFPDIPGNRGFVQRRIATAAEQMPVVLLSAGAQLDDHRDALIASGAHVLTIATDVRDNLAAQSAVVAGARGGRHAPLLSLGGSTTHG